MAQEQYDDIVIRLDNIQHLFFVPTEDPLAAHIQFESGIEYLKRALTPARLRHKERLRAVIVVPTADNIRELTARIQAALQSYCRFHMQQDAARNTALLKDSLRALLLGAIFLISGLFVFHQVALLTRPSLLVDILSNSFNIAFWIILWRPGDFLLFDLPAYQRERRVYECIMQMHMIVIAAEV